MRETPRTPGRAVRTSASGLMSDALIPKAARSWGVATNTGPDQLRPAAACWSEALVWSSSMTVLEPRALAMLAATAAWACGVLVVAGPLEPLGPMLGPLLWGVYTMSWFEATFGPA